MWIIDLRINYLQARLPQALGTMLVLKSLQLQDNKLTSSLPASLAWASELEILHLSSNHFQGGLPKALRSMRTSASLALHQNRLSSSLSDALESLRRIKFLWWSFENHFEGSLRGSSQHLRRDWCSSLQGLVSVLRLQVCWVCQAPRAGKGSILPTLQDAVEQRNTVLPL